MSKHDPHGPAGYEKTDAHAGDTYRAGFYILGAMFLTALVLVPMYRFLGRSEARGPEARGDRAPARRRGRRRPPSRGSSPRSRPSSPSSAPRRSRS